MNSSDDKYSNTQRIEPYQEFVFPLYFIVRIGFNLCGPSNRSINGELGWFEDVDRCCQKHDECGAIYLSWAPNESIQGLKNPLHYTLNQCICDKKFYDCLDKVRRIHFLFAVGVKWVFRYTVDKCAFFGPEMQCRMLIHGRCEDYVISRHPTRPFHFWQLLNNKSLKWIV